MVASLRLSGFDLFFESMSNIDMSLLRKKAGIYMITNKINGKFYIGKSKDIAVRFYAYLNNNRLENNKNIRINRALLKYGYSNFSLTILEFIDLKQKKPAKKLTQRREYRDLIRKAFGLKSHDVLTLREDFFIKIRNADGFKVEAKKIKGLKSLKEHTQLYKSFIDKKCLNSFFPPSTRSYLPQPSGKLIKHRPLDIGKTSLKSYSTYSRNLELAPENKKPIHNIFLKRAIYNFIKASVNNQISGVHFQDSTALITFLKEFDPDFNMSRQSIHNYKKRKLVFKGFLMNSDVSRFFAYVNSRFPEFDPSAFLEKCSPSAGACNPIRNKTGYVGLLKSGFAKSFS
ncbi:hypothetical protein Tco_1445965 [Tanacetum coccineum]